MSSGQCSARKLNSVLRSCPCRCRRLPSWKTWSQLSSSRHAAASAPRRPATAFWWRTGYIDVRGEVLGVEVAPAFVATLVDDEAVFDLPDRHAQRVALATRRFDRRRPVMNDPHRNWFLFLAHCGPPYRCSCPPSLARSRSMFLPTSDEGVTSWP